MALTVKSSSRSSLSSRLSSLSKTGLKFAFPNLSRRSSASANELCAVNEFAQIVSLVTLRKEEAIESDALAELPVGTVVEILALGEGRRIRVRVVKDKVEGWISYKTQQNEALIEKCQVEGFEVGTQYEVYSVVTVRAEESLESELIAKLEPGQLVTIRELGVKNKRRIKMISNYGPQPCVEGWISITTANKEQLIGKLVTQTRLVSETGTNFNSYEYDYRCDAMVVDNEDVVIDTQERSVQKCDEDVTQTLIKEIAIADTDVVDEDASTEDRQSEDMQSEDTPSELETTKTPPKLAESDSSCQQPKDQDTEPKDCGEQGQPKRPNTTSATKSRRASTTSTKKKTTKSTSEDPDKATAKPKAKSKGKAKAKAKKPASAEE